MPDLIAQYYLQNPYAAMPWARAVEGALSGGVELANLLRAKREAEIERQRLTKAEPEITRLQNILRYGDPNSEEYKQAQAALSSSPEFRPVFEYGPIRRAIRERRGLPTTREGRAQPLFTPEERQSLYGATTSRREDDYLLQQLLDRARREAEMKYDVSGRAIERISEKPTSVTYQGYGFDTWAKERPGIEQEKLDIARAKLAKTGGGGGGGGGGEPPDQNERYRYIRDYGNAALSAKTGQPFMDVKGQRAQAWLRQAVTDIASKPTYNQAVSAADQWLQAIDWGDPELNEALRVRLTSARSGLYQYFGKQPTAGQAAVPASAGTSDVESQADSKYMR